MRDFAYSRLFRTTDIEEKASAVYHFLNEAKKMEKRGFYNPHEAEQVKIKAGTLKGIDNAAKLYDALLHVWCEATCAPRLRPGWSKENPTLGQCSITSFLIQDLCGGEVYGVPLKEGGYHCFNVVDGHVFDLTSEQFGEEAKDLDYSLSHPQSREEHFKAREKYERYLLLGSLLREYVGE